MGLHQQIEHHADMRGIQFVLRHVAERRLPPGMVARPVMQVVHQQPATRPQKLVTSSSRERIRLPQMRAVEEAEIIAGLADAALGLFAQETQQEPVVTGLQFDGADVAS